MLKHSKAIGILGKAKMKALLFVAILDAIQNIVMEATDRLIVGNLIGSDAVSGEMLIGPALTLGTVFEVRSQWGRFSLTYFSRLPRIGS